MQFLQCICSVFYFLNNLLKHYHNLFTKLNHKKNYGVRHSVRARSSPRKRPRLPPPTYAHTRLLGEKLSGGGVKNIRRRNSYAAAEQRSRAGAGGPKNRKKIRNLSHTAKNTLLHILIHCGTIPYLYTIPKTRS